MGHAVLVKFLINIVKAGLALLLADAKVDQAQFLVSKVKQDMCIIKLD